MNKKALYSILSIVVAMIILSISLVLTIGPKVSADSEEVGILDKAEYFNFADEACTIINGLSISGDRYANQHGIFGLKVVFPDGIKEVHGVSGFENYQNASVFTLYDTWLRTDEVTDGSWTYFHSDKIIEVILPESLETIGDYAFYNCSQLSQIVIPENVTEIGENVFDNCYDLERIVLENDDLFDHPNLAEYNWKLKHGGVGVMDKAEYFDILGDNELHGISAAGIEYIKTFGKIDVVFPDVKAIYSANDYYSGAIGVFSTPGLYLTNGLVMQWPSYYGFFVNSITLPDTLEVIGERAFLGCNFNSITIPASVTAIGEHVFDDCSDLTEIIVENQNLINHENLQPYANIVHAANCTVTFDSGVTSQKVDYGATVSEPTAPTKDGYEFKGWLLNGEPYDFTTPVTEDITLTAKWEEIQTQPEPETPTEENTEVNNKNNSGLIWGITGGSAGVLILIGVVIGVVIAKRRRK